MGLIEINQNSLPEQDIYNQGKEEITNLRILKVGSGSNIFVTDKEGSRWGHHQFDNANAWIKMDGSFKFKNNAGTTLIDSEDADGNFVNVINESLNTSSKKILQDFTFEATDYAGAFKTGNPTWNTTTGLPTGGTGVLINAKGIMGVNSGNTVFSIDVDGNATFAGTLSAPSGTLGTITAGTITGATVQSAATGYRAKLSSSGLQFLYNDTVKGGIAADTDDTIVYTSTNNHTFFSNGNYAAQINGSGLTLPDDVNFNSNAYGLSWADGRFLNASVGDGIVIKGGFASNADDTDFLGRSNKRWSDFYAKNCRCTNYYSGDGSQGQDYSTHKIITDIWMDGSDLKCKERYYTFKDGLVTDRSSESTRTIN